MPETQAGTETFPFNALANCCWKVCLNAFIKINVCFYKLTWHYTLYNLQLLTASQTKDEDKQTMTLAMWSTLIISPVDTIFCTFDIIFTSENGCHSCIIRQHLIRFRSVQIGSHIRTRHSLSVRDMRQHMRPAPSPTNVCGRVRACLGTISPTFIFTLGKIQMCRKPKVQRQLRNIVAFKHQSIHFKTDTKHVQRENSMK